MNSLKIIIKGGKFVINYNKNELINTTLDKYYETFSHMLDTSDYVPDKFNDKIGKYIFKNLKKTFKLIDSDDRKFQRKFKKDIKNLEKEKRLEERKLAKENKPKKEKFKRLKNILNKLKGLMKFRFRKTKETNPDN
jgi:septin family protein